MNRSIHYITYIFTILYRYLYINYDITTERHEDVWEKCDFPEVFSSGHGEGFLCTGRRLTGVLHLN